MMKYRLTTIGGLGAAAIAIVAAAVAAGVAMFDEATSRTVVVAASLAALASAAALLALLLLRDADRRRADKTSVGLQRDLRALSTRTEPLRELRQMHKSTGERLASIESALGAVGRSGGGSGATGPRALERRLEDTSYHLYKQLEARERLAWLLDLDRPLPPMRGFAVSPDLALDLVERILAGTATNVVETGSGTSTLLMALALEKADGGHVWAIEHEPDYAEATRRLLAEFGCTGRATVIDAPLVDHDVAGESFPWYDITSLPIEPASIDLLLVDGPPAATGPLSRFPALPLLRDRLRPGAVVLLDDARRADEHEVVERWTGSGEISGHRYLRHEKGTAELVWDPVATAATPVADPDHPSTATAPTPSGAGESPAGRAGAPTGDSPADSARARVVDSTELPESVWREPGGERASYMYKLHESKRRRHLLPLLGHRQRVWAYNSKPDGYALARSLGISTPETYIGSTTIDRLDWDALPTRFALKPHNGAANRGVYLLVRKSDGRFRNALGGQVLGVDEIVDSYEQLVADGKVTPRFAVEELLEPRPELVDRIDIPDDLKVYCFYDQVTVTMQRRMYGDADRNNWRFKIWDADWQDLGPVKYADRYDAGLERPYGAEGVARAATTIARHLRIPFVRLDLFDTARGTVFGEVSVHPGPPEVWDEQSDEMLGRAWEIAEARLLAEGVLPSEPRPGSDGTT